MAAPKGNQFWKVRCKHGREKSFSNAAFLYESTCEYFEWSDKNPLKEQKVFSNGTRKTVNKVRPYTIKALCIFLGIDENTWCRYRKEETYKDFWEVIAWADSVIYTQKFENAAAGLLNANLISRDLGLIEKTDVTTNGQSINQNDDEDLSNMTDDELREIRTIYAEAAKRKAGAGPA